MDNIKQEHVAVITYALLVICVYYYIHIDGNRCIYSTLVL